MSWVTGGEGIAARDRGVFPVGGQLGVDARYVVFAVGVSWAPVENIWGEFEKWVVSVCGLASCVDRWGGGSPHDCVNG